MNVIDICGVKKEYAGEGKIPVAVLRDIAMQVSRGEYIWLKGRSGSGKTTLLNLAAGLDIPTKGAVSLMGLDTRKYLTGRMSALRNSKIGFVFQVFPILSGTVFENVSLPLKLRRAPKREIENKTHAILETVGLKELAQKNVMLLSGGEQQRVVFARALLKEPEIVFADEPFSNLDDDTATPLIGLLAELNKAGKTVFLVTHSYENRIKPTRVLTIEGGELRQL